MALISKRLCAIANMVTKGLSVADIGCDHAHLSIYLVQNQIAQKVIACDINAGPIEKAKQNIMAAGLKDRINARQADGLSGIACAEVESVVIAGMGGKLIGHILSDGREVLDGADEVILGPQSDIRWVRDYLISNDFVISDEDFIIEDGKYYPIIKAIHGKSQEYEEVYLRYGKIPIERKNIKLKEFLEKEREHLQTLIDRLMESDVDGKGEQRIRQLRDDLDICHKALEKIGGNTK